MDIVIDKAVLADKIYFKQEDVNDFAKLRYTFSYVHNRDVFSTLQETDNGNWSLGIGCLDRLTIKKLDDQRIDTSCVLPKSNVILYPEQQEAIDQLYGINGILNARCSYGKTFALTSFIGEYQKPTLVLVHTTLLWNQWIEECRKQLGYEPGKIGAGEFEVKDLTIGLYLTVSNRIEELKKRFSLILVDEVHRCPSEIYSKVVNNLWAKYKIGASATLTRRDGGHLLLPDYFGSRIIKGKEYKTLLTPTVDFLASDFSFLSINPKTDWSKTLTSLYSNSRFIERVANYANDKITDGYCPLILGDRIEALEKLQTLIPGSKLVVGKTKDRETILAEVGKSVSCIISTSIFDEGVSCHRLDLLMPLSPSSNFAKLEQRIGRIQREHPDKQPPRIAHILLKGAIVSKQQLTLYRWYKSLNYDIREIL